MNYIITFHLALTTNSSCYAKVKFTEFMYNYNGVVPFILGLNLIFLCFGVW